MTGPRADSSFAMAARLLPAAVRRDAVTLYAFCRRVDDLVDHADDAAQARSALERERSALLDPRSADQRVIKDLCARRGVPVSALLCLIDTIATDLGPVRIADRLALFDYCYGVAGTVGVAMCAVLGAERPEALAPAIDLGMAMQLSNIARDVVEDAERDRLYLPADLVGRSLEPRSLLDDDSDRGQAARRAAWGTVVELLDLADQLYRRADRGMVHIPSASRLAIMASARAYQAIGTSVRRLGYAGYWRSRARLSKGQRAAALARAALAFPATLLADSTKGSAAVERRPGKGRALVEAGPTV